MKPANPDLKHVQIFCDSLVSNGSPLILPNAPALDAKRNECFNIVKAHIREHGGEQHFGWAIWEWAGLLLEAQFHSVWESDDGDLVDVTPQAGRFNDITFLIDPRLVYEGFQIDNIRKLMCSDPIAERYCVLREKFFRDVNRDDLAKQHGLATLTGAAFDTHQEMQELVIAMYARTVGKK